MIDGINSNKIRYKKSLGQNFIFDKNLLFALANDALINKNDTLIEVGVGAATLTRAIAAKAKKVIGIEIDSDLQPVIDSALKDIHNVHILYKDILKLSHSDILGITSGEEFKVVANLPYYITTPVIFHFLESDLPIKSMTLTVQKEVAMRMAALENTADYGALSLAIAARANAKITRHINRQMFTPVPNVDSAVVHLDIVRPFNKILARVIKSLFAMRRKTALNNLCKDFCIKKEDGVSLLDSVNISINARGEQLSLLQVTDLTKAICNFLNREFC